MDRLGAGVAAVVTSLPAQYDLAVTTGIETEGQSEQEKKKPVTMFPLAGETAKRIEKKSTFLSLPKRKGK